jgi:membrane-associated phospholipid phosphatase
MTLTVIDLLLWHQLETFDKWLFTKINSQFTNSFFDYLMPYLRNSNYWIPLYLFLFFFVVLNFKTNGWWWCLFFLCLISLTDIISSRFFKDVVERVRPCNDIDMFSHIRLLVACPAGYSFTSSHAANHFGMASFFFFTFRHIISKWAWMPFVWAFFIVYAQVYVGVHYPLDVLGGAALGMLIAWTLALFFNKRFGFANFDKQQIA